MFGECFKYLQGVLKMIFHNSGVVWSENLLKKMEKTQNFRDAPKLVLKTFLSDMFTFPSTFHFYDSYDSNFLPTHWRYLKHSPNVKKCVGKKIRVERTTRRNENIKGNVKILLKKVFKTDFGASRKFWVFSIFWGDFHFKRLYNCEKSFSTHFEGTWNTLRKSRDVLVKKLESYDS